MHIHDLCAAGPVCPALREVVDMSPTWHLKPGSFSLDLDADDDEVVHDTLCETPSPPHTPPTPSRVLLIDSDSELERCDRDWVGDNSIHNPLTPRLRPRDPHFGFSEDALLRPIEIKSCRICQREEPPTRQELLDIFLTMPVSYLRRRTDPASGHVARYLVAGASPRSTGDILSLCTECPYLTLLVNRYLQHAAPHHRFSTFVIRSGCLSRVHRDTRNAPFPSLIVSLSESGHGDGIWLHDPIGKTFKDFEGKRLPGVVIPIVEPFMFDARRTLHAGHVVHPHRAPSRVVLIAFTTLTHTQLQIAPRARLYGLGFPLPRPGDPHSHGLMNDFGAPCRERQLTIEEALHLPVAQSNLHDVIEVLDSQD